MDDNWQNPDFDDWEQWPAPPADRAGHADDLDFTGNGHDQFGYQPEAAGEPDGERPLAGSIEAAVRLEELERAQHQLWAALRSEDDPDIRMALLSRLSENRSAILALGHQWGFETGQPPGRASTSSSSSTSSAYAPRQQWNPGSSPAPDNNDDASWLPGEHSAGRDSAGRDSAGRDSAGRYSAGRHSAGQSAGSSASDLPYIEYSTNGSAPDQTPPTGGQHAAGGPSPYIPAPGHPDPQSQQLSAEPMPARVPPPPTLSSMPGGPRPGEPGLGALTDQLKENFKRLSTPSGVRREPFTNQRIAIVAGAVLSLLAVAWLVTSQTFGHDQETSAGATAADAASASTVPNRVPEITGVLAKMNLGSVSVDQQGSVVHLSGTVASESERTTVLGVVGAMVDSWGTVSSDLTVAGATPPPQGATPSPASARASAMQNEMNRLLAATPLIFDTGQTALTELHVRILNNMAVILKGYPEVPVSIIGYTDNVGSSDANSGLSRARAEGVKAYLVSQGVPPAGLVTKGEGEATSTGSQNLASLERRVYFQAVVPVAAPPAAGKKQLKVAIVAPSARNDLAFSQSMVDAVNTVAKERGSVQVDVTDSTFVPADAAAAIQRYADANYDLIIAHGVEFGAELVNIVKAHPHSVFAWGTASDTFGLPNLYAYDAAAEEGGYVEGAMASLLSAKGVVGVVGPIQVADAQRYIDGFTAGALAEKPTISVPVTYTGSFSDVPLATEAAKAHVAAGADVLTGTAEMVVGAVSVAHDSKALWFGTQANQSSLAPDVVVASQVYHWEVLLRPIVAEIDAGAPNGRAMVAQLGNDGLVIEYNPAYPLAPPVRARADQLVADIRSGALKPPTAG